MFSAILCYSAGGPGNDIITVRDLLGHEDINLPALRPRQSLRSYAAIQNLRLQAFPTIRRTSLPRIVGGNGDHEEQEGENEDGSPTLPIKDDPVLLYILIILL
jgi:hypothetical protein